MTIQEHIEAIEQALTGAGYDDEKKQHDMKMAVAKQAAMDMDDEEKKEAMKFFEKDDDKKKEGMSEDEDEKEKMGMDDEKELNDGKNGMKEDDEDEDKSGEIAKTVEENKHRMGYSYNPATNNLYDITEEGAVNKLRSKLIGPNGFDPKKRIYISSVSNHQGGAGRRLHSAFEEAGTMSPTPLIGGWKSTEVNGLYYADGAYPFQANSIEEALARGKHYQQESIMVLEPDGGYEFI